MESLHFPSVSGFARHWTLDPNVVFLNHGSFGACPTSVLEVQQVWRARMERQPLQFFGQDIEGLLDQARADLAQFVGADAEDLAFVTNATTGVNTVLQSLRFEAGAEVLTTSQEYNACRNALDAVAERWDLQVVIADVSFPIVSPQAVIDAVLAQVSDRTRLVLLDHVVSQTGLVFPLETLIPALRERGIETLIDGAHAPGMLPLNLQQLGATYYSGNCHKWLCAPKGAAFLYVQRDRQSHIRPLTISHGANSPRSDRSRFRLEFDWVGTDDPTPYLCVPSAIQFLDSLFPGGWAELMARNHALAVQAQQVICAELEISLPCPDTMLGSMVAVPLPDGAPLVLQAALLDQYQIEVPIVPFPNTTSRIVRVSAQLYNTVEQYQYLATALTTLLAKE